MKTKVKKVLVCAVIMIMSLTLVQTSSAVVDQQIGYGASGKQKESNAMYNLDSKNLIARKIEADSNNKNKIAVLVFEQHGWEDAWAADGQELCSIGNSVANYFKNNPSKLNGWTLYVISKANPDAISYGTTNLGRGRCTVIGRVNMNRNFPYDFQGNSSIPPEGTIGAYNYPGSSSLSVWETLYLSDFLKKIKTSSVNSAILVDFHGWLNYCQGDADICTSLNKEFKGFTNIQGKYKIPSSYDQTTQSFYAKIGSYTNSTGTQYGFLYRYAYYTLQYKAALMEYPWPQTFSGNAASDSTKSEGQKYINNKGYATKTYTALANYFSTH